MDDDRDGDGEEEEEEDDRDNDEDDDKDNNDDVVDSMLTNHDYRCKLKKISSLHNILLDINNTKHYL